MIHNRGSATVRPWRRLRDTDRRVASLPGRILFGLLLLGLLLLAPGAPATAAPAGLLDPEFGMGGMLRTNLGGTYDWAYATAVQPDGAILAAGVTNSADTYDFALARYLPSGALDSSFGDDGIVVTDFGGSYDWAYALALQPDGRIVLGGVSDVSGSKDFALARYLPDGSLDADFGERGLLLLSRPLSTDLLRGLALQPDGRLVAVGVTYDEAFSVRPQGDFIVARYTVAGRPDLTFGVAGVVQSDFEGGSYEEALAVVLQPDGGVVVGGYSTNAAGPRILVGADDLALARYTPEGLPDRSFGEGGVVTLDAGSLDEEIRALALTREGEIVAGGYTSGEKGGDFVVARFERDGRPDQHFGEAGLSRTDLGTRSERISAIALLPDGHILAGGQVSPDPTPDFALVRFDRAGRLDPTFGSGGLARIDFGGRDDRVRAVVVQPDGKVVAVGSSEADFAVVRVRSTPG